MMCAVTRVHAFVLVALLAALAPAGAQAATSGQRDRAVDWAVRQTGHHEIGTTNRSAKIDRWTRAMGLKVPPARPWCGAFVHQAFLRTGVRLSPRLIDPDRSYADAKARRRGLRVIPVSRVRRGDLLFFAFRAGMKASHLAIARGRPRAGSIDTIEGNVSHAVRQERRGTRYVVLAARVTAR
jgi:cell wall-associated NlpC family hydrolase